MSPCYQGGEEGPWPKLGLPGLVWKSKLAWHFVIWHLRATETSIYSASDVVSISAVGKKRKRACIRLKVFLDSNLEATAGQFGVVNLKSTHLLGRSDNLTSQHLLSHPPMHKKLLRQLLAWIQSSSSKGSISFTCWQVTPYFFFPPFQFVKSGNRKWYFLLGVENNDRH